MLEDYMRPARTGAALTVLVWHSFDLDSLQRADRGRQGFLAPAISRPSFSAGAVALTRSGPRSARRRPQDRSAARSERGSPPATIAPAIISSVALAFLSASRIAGHVSP